MACDRYFELLSTRLDGALTPKEERELEEHLLNCPDCRAVGAQLAALQAGFSELEEVPAPEGFAQGVMDRIGAEKQVIPLFKRPQLRALAGLAACLVLVAGLYGASRWKTQEKTMLMNRSFQNDALWEETVDGADASACESLDGDADGPQVNAALVSPEPTDAPQIAAYAAPNPAQADASAGTAGAAPEVFGYGGTEDLQKAAPNPAADGLTENRLFSLELSENTLAMDYFPEGAAELLPLETVVQPYPGGGTVYLDIPKDIYDQIQRLAMEQGMAFSCALTGDGGAENGPFTLIILEE